jgi:hypothetical protein
MTTPAPQPPCTPCPPLDCASLSACSVNQLGDVDTATTPPTIGQVLAWNGTQWVPTNPGE